MKAGVVNKTVILASPGNGYKDPFAPVKIITRLLKICLTLFIFSTTTVFADPVLNNIASGQVTVQQTGDGNTLINQTSQKAILNWHSFNIAAPEHTHFQQPVNGVA